MFRCLTASKVHQLSIFEGGSSNLIEFVVRYKPHGVIGKHLDIGKRTPHRAFSITFAPRQVSANLRPDHLGTVAISGNEQAKHGIVRDRIIRPSPANTRDENAVIWRTHSSAAAAMVPHIDLIARPEPHPTLKPALVTY